MNKLYELMQKEMDEALLGDSRSIKGFRKKCKDITYDELHMKVLDELGDLSFEEILLVSKVFKILKSLDK